MHRGRTYDDAARAADLGSRFVPTSRQTEIRGLPTGMSPELLAAWRKESEQLANDIRKAMDWRLDVTDRGTKTKGLSVLKWTAAPAVLVEVGFLSNPRERRLLSDPAYRTRIARAIAEGVLSFRRRFEEAHAVP